MFCFYPILVVNSCAVVTLLRQPHILLMVRSFREVVTRLCKVVTCDNLNHIKEVFTAIYPVTSQKQGTSQP